MIQLFDETALTPNAWVNGAITPCHLFNPAITRFQGQLLLIYRVVTPDGCRRLAMCRLTDDRQVVPGSVTPFSDFLQAGGDWHADGRFCPFGDRLFVHYNDGGLRGRQGVNQIYLVEVDPARLLPQGLPRPLLLTGPRQPVEKNWLLFEHDGEMWAIYTIAPHVVLHVTLGQDGPVLCRPVYQHDWDAQSYTRRYGQLRGGAPPVRVGDQYVVFFHSSFVARPWRHRLYRLLRQPPTNTIYYVGGVYGFAAQPPFAPLWLHPLPLLMPPRLPRRRQQLNPAVAYSAYPCGAIWEDQQWLVTLGGRDEYCCLTQVAPAAIQPEPIRATLRR
jgi:predicted GH43/DUF377 family glycosyl hydrolase